MAIDDPKDAFEQQYMQDEQTLPLKLATFAGKLGFPGGGLAAEILINVRDVLINSVSAKERLKALWELFRIEFSHIDSTKASHEDVQKAIQLSFLYDRVERDDKKRERYVKLIGNAV